MQEFPFTKQEWDELSQTTLAMMNASLQEDETLKLHYWESVQTILEGLRDKYGNHPVLTETLADFEDSPEIRVALYRQAIAEATENQLPTYTIRISFAGVLIEDFKAFAQAKQELILCEDEVLRQDDPAVKSEWQELSQICARES